MSTPFCHCVVILLSVGFVSCQVSIDPINPVRPGDVFPAHCRTVAKGDSSCQWEINDRVLALKQDGRLRPRTSDNSTCSVEVTAADEINGKWVCKLFSYSAKTQVGTANITVSVISIGRVNFSLPSIILDITADQRKQITCIASSVRPLPSIVWELGNQTLDVKEYDITSQEMPDGLLMLKSILTRTFRTNEHSRTLRCRVQAPWLSAIEETVAETRLNIKFPPLPQKASKHFGFRKSSFGDIHVTVSANPRPHRVTWILPSDSGETLEVEPNLDDPVDENYRGFLGEDYGNSSYTYRLNIESVETRDSDPGIYLEVTNIVNNENKTTRYLAQAFVGAQASQASQNEVRVSQRILLLNTLMLTMVLARS